MKIKTILLMKIIASPLHTHTQPLTHQEVRELRFLGCLHSGVGTLLLGQLLR